MTRVSTLNIGSCIHARSSLPRGRLPEFYLVALGIHDPAKLSVLGIVHLVQDVASFVAKCLTECGQAFDPDS